MWGHPYLYGLIADLKSYHCTNARFNGGYSLPISISANNKVYR